MRNKHDFSLSGQISFDLDFLLCRRTRENTFSVFGHRDHTKLLDIKYNEIYLPQKSIRFIKIGFIAFFFFLFFSLSELNHFLTKTGRTFRCCPKKNILSQCSCVSVESFKDFIWDTEKAAKKKKCSVTKRSCAR